MKKVEVTDCIGLELPENQNIRILSIKTPKLKCAFLKTRIKKHVINKHAARK